MFAFFRRRQKLVIIVMVILMVSFLAGFKGLSALMSPNRASKPIGRFADGDKLRVKHYWAAKADLEILSMAGVQSDLIYGLRQNRGEQEILTYAMLTHESESFGPVLESRVESFLNYHLRQLITNEYVRNVQAGIPVKVPEINDELLNATYRGMLSRLQGADVSELQFRQALTRLVRNQEAYRYNAMVSPPSMTELKYYFNCLEEKVALEYFLVSAEQFMDQVPGPETFDEAAIQAQFDTYRDVLAGLPSVDNPYGFGYRSPRRLDVSYAVVGIHQLLVAIQPSDEDILAQFRTNKSEYVREEDTGELDADGEPIMTLVELSPGEAREQIVATLLPVASEKAASEILRRVEKLANDYEGDGDAFAAAAAAVKRPADAVLATVLTDVQVDNETVYDAMHLLAEQAGIQGISFPNIRDDGEVLAGEETISLRGTMTLGEALAKVGRQLGMADMTWVQCATLTGPDAILFSDGERGTFPVMAGRTGLVDYLTMVNDPIIRFVHQGDPEADPRQTMANILFTSDFFPTEEELAADDLSAYEARLPETLSQYFYPTMQLIRPPFGLVAWRVLEVSNSTSPEALTEALRAEVIEDLRTVEAMALATARADELLGQMRDASFELVAERAGYDTRTTPLFSRRQMPTYGLQMAWSPVAGLNLPPGVARQAFIEPAFELATPDAFEGLGGTPVAPKNGVIPVPADRAVSVVHVLDHQPAMMSTFTEAGVGQLSTLAIRTRQTEAAIVWTNYDTVVRRTGFVEKKAKQVSADE